MKLVSQAYTIDTDLSVTSTESAIWKIFQGSAGVVTMPHSRFANAGETMTLPVAVEEVESVVCEESIEVALCEKQPAPILANTQFDEMLVQMTLEEKFFNLKSQFFCEVAHEIRTPLTVILLSAELLERYGDECTEKQKREYLHCIKEAAEQVSRLFDDTLANYDSIGNGKA